MTFVRLFGKDEKLVFVNVVYYFPDYKNVLNEFHWQTLDLPPRYPRVRRFVDFWESEIEAQIKRVILNDSIDFRANDYKHFDLEEFFKHHE